LATGGRVVPRQGFEAEASAEAVRPGKDEDGFAGGRAGDQVGFIAIRARFDLAFAFEPFQAQAKDSFPPQLGALGDRVGGGMEDRSAGVEGWPFVAADAGVDRDFLGGEDTGRPGDAAAEGEDRQGGNRQVPQSTASSTAPRRQLRQEGTAAGSDRCLVGSRREMSGRGRLVMRAPR
jgi:hypothetical protein